MSDGQLTSRPLLSTSVGFGNHRSFIVLLFLALVTALGGFPLLATVSRLHIDNLGFIRAVIAHPELFITASILIILVIALVPLLVFHLKIVATNFTTNEQFNAERYSYLWQLQDNRPRFVNPSDRGLSTNCWEFWTRSVSRAAYAVDDDEPTLLQGSDV